jgi:hypothetical protein
MRTIQVSTDVYAAIWADRQSGEENEDQMLARKYGVQRQPPNRDIAVSVDGFSDPKYGVQLRPGFTIYRDYKKRRFTATAVQGFWISSHDQKGYGSLNELSVAIGAGKENAWGAWFYDDPETGKRRPVSDLRDPGTIKKKTKPVLTAADMGWQ